MRSDKKIMTHYRLHKIIKYKYFDFNLYRIFINFLFGHFSKNTLVFIIEIKNICSRELNLVGRDIA